MKGRKGKNVPKANEAKLASSESTNGQSKLKRGRARKEDIEHSVSKPTDEKTIPEDLLLSSQKNQVNDKKMKNVEVDNLTNANSIVRNGANSSEGTNPNAPKVKRMGRPKKNHTEVDLKLDKINGKSVPEDLALLADENKADVNVVPDSLDVADVQNVAVVEESQDVLQNKTSVPNNSDSKEKNKNLVPAKLGRKKKVDEKTAIEDLKVVPISEYKAEEKPPVKRGRKNLKAKNDAESDNTEALSVATVPNVPDISSEANIVDKTEYKAEEKPVKRGRKNLKAKNDAESDSTQAMSVATNPNVPDISSEANIVDNTSSKVSGKRGRKKLEIFEEVEDSKRIKTNENIASNEKDDNASELLTSSNTEIDKDELSDFEIKVTESFPKKPVVKKKKANVIKKSPPMGTKSCFVKLDRDKVVENAAQEICSILPERKLEENKTKKTANNGESSKGKNKRGKDANEDGSKLSKVPKKVTKSSETKNIAKTPEMEALDFGNTSTNLNGKPWNIKISSWNINGVRAWLEKDGISYINHEDPDIITLQETKCSDDKFPDKIGKIDNYHSYWVSGDKEGYSGVCLLSKQKPIEVKYGIDVDLHDTEGRVITAEYENFFVVAAYVPNAGRGLIRLEYRTQWDEDFRSYLKKLDSKKPIVLCGDLNVAHEEIDLANPKTNKKNAGFTKEEREGFSTLLEEGFIDSFRHLYPDAKGAYTFWTYMMNARLKNVGWRLDYFVLSKRLSDNLCDSIIRKDVYGSDHCPITLFLAL